MDEAVAAEPLPFLGSSFLRDMGSETRYLLIRDLGEMVVYEKHLADFSDEVTELEQQRERLVGADGDSRRVHRPRRAGPGRGRPGRAARESDSSDRPDYSARGRPVVADQHQHGTTARSGTRLATTRIGPNE